MDVINKNLKDTLRLKQALSEVVRARDIQTVDVVRGRCSLSWNAAQEAFDSVWEVQDELDDDELRALTCKNQELKGVGAALSHRHLSSVHWNLEETINELNATRNGLSAAEDNLKETKEEMENYRQQVEDMQHQLSEAEFTFQGQITVQERNAVANWMKVRDWERRIVQQRRENAYLKHSLRMMEGEMLPVGPTRRRPMPGRPELLNPLWQAPRPRMNSRTGPQKDPEMATVSAVGIFSCVPF
ncbi:transport and Golgi organization protein 1 homolog isoform X2 [Mustela putorius furo]|uniref:Transport and Golgi organization protein 1 homolog isoform X2 n=1 Tax=Mustela putorius furo TaxID=9669 RepID=A0A8U0RN45_MUSPF|nr:transport and Golgi organization protein 1 homolog isoform X2 [Mustela putorius furo]